MVFALFGGEWTLWFCGSQHPDRVLLLSLRWEIYSGPNMFGSAALSSVVPQGFVFRFLKSFEQLNQLHLIRLLADDILYVSVKPDETNKLINLIN